ncbi:hypothetical protein GOEFS_075_00300 [Gordonia effusa NBRC 100432]|uniref:Tetratricopeptide repeat protein n=1 Tax=Gordonia effusa NBRC 100432 TaxID=1077974 RepID=H0R204_9ACTN|nr:hypothetical protein [Gordonia effusa]GAB19109.1 hypothetical protein GOEFS_075_00300 [Gordonia effusa NBRC 100432]
MSDESADPTSGPKQGPDLTRKDARPIVWMVGFICVALVVYLVLLGKQGIDLIAEGSVVGIGLGFGVLILPLLGAWMLYTTLHAGIEHQKLARIMKAEGRELDVSQLPRRASGRIERDAADELFAQVKQEWEADPADWRSTYRIARAYDYAGDRKRAREMMTRAVKQFRAAE